MEALAPLYAGALMKLAVGRDAMVRVKRARDMVDVCVDSGQAVYGVTTGFGRLKGEPIDSEDLRTLQRNLIISHCCGVGEPLPDGEVRAAQVLRLNGLVRGHSGVRPSLVRQLVRLFNAGFVPIVPRQGSVGASGDLAPLAHMAAAYMGHGKARIPTGRKGERKTMSARAAVKKIGEEPVTLEAKEGLALVNGTEVMKAVGVGAWLRATNISKAADAIASLSIEALLGSMRPFDPRLAELKGGAGHGRTASNVRACLEGSEVLESHLDCDRVQDPYSLRCVPQIHGAVKDALAHIEEVLAREVNSVTDNPVLFPDTKDVISAGMFHGQSLSMALDYLAIALSTLANVSERRTEQLVNPDLSRLPSFLTDKPGLNSGMMIAQVAAAALASENKVHAHPASVDTIPTSANQEDHVSMGMTAANKARTVCSNVEQVLAIEALCAAQGREFHGELRAGPGAAATRTCLRTRVPAMDRDRYLADDLDAARDLVASGTLVAAVEKVVGPLQG